MNAWLCTRNVATRASSLCVSHVSASSRPWLRVACYAVFRWPVLIWVLTRPLVSELELWSDCEICDQPSFLQPVLETSLLHIFLI